MGKIDKDKVDRLIHSMALKNNMSDIDMKRLVESPYEFANMKMRKIDLEGVETEEDFNKLKTNFIFPEFIRLVIDYISLEARNNRRKNIDKLNNKE